MFGAVLQPGDVMHHRMAGGGGHGNPLERDPHAVAQRRARRQGLGRGRARGCTASSSATTARSTSRRPRSCGGARCDERLWTSCCALRRRLAPDTPERRTIGRDGHGRDRPVLGLPTSRPYAIEPNRRNRDVSVNGTAPSSQRFVHRSHADRSAARRRRSPDGPWSDDVTVGSALLASAGGDRVSILLGLEPAWPAAHALGPALTVQGAPGDNLALHHAVAAGRAGRGDRARGRRRDADRPLRRHRRARRPRARASPGSSLDGAIRDRSADRARSACRSSTSAPRRAARARTGPARCASRSRSPASTVSPATSSAPTRTAIAVVARRRRRRGARGGGARSRSASARSSRRSSAARRRSRSSG